MFLFCEQKLYKCEQTRIYMKQKIKEIYLRFYDDEKDLVNKLSKLQGLFNEKTENKTIKKIIKEFEIK